jgi:hypothetical protein
MKKIYLLLFFLLFLVTSQIMAQSTPFEGKPSVIPGIVLGERYDAGGEGVAYHDMDAANQGATIRTSEGVDIEACSAGGYDIGWTNAGEWINFTVQIDSTAVYEVETAVASNQGVATAPYTFVLNFASGTATDTFKVPNTGGWETWITLKDTVELTKSIDTMKLVEVTNGFNYRHAEFTRMGADARIDSIMIGDSVIAGFFSWNTIKEFRLPYQTVPAATAYLADDLASAVITNATAYSDTTFIVVTSKDGTFTRTYKFSLVKMSSDASLSDIKISNVSLEGFNPSTFSYNVELPFGTTKVPSVSAVVNEPHAKYKSTRATALPGTTTILVTAEDKTTATYSVNFTVAPSAIKESDNSDAFAVYPNPASGQTTIDLSSLEGKNTILTITTLQGQVIQQLDVTGLDNYILSLNHLQDAVYFISVISPERIQVQKLFVK